MSKVIHKRLTCSDWDNGLHQRLIAISNNHSTYAPARRALRRALLRRGYYGDDVDYNVASVLCECGFKRSNG